MFHKIVIVSKPDLARTFACLVERMPASLFIFTTYQFDLTYCKGGLRDEIAMETVRRLAAEVARGLSETHPKLRKTVVSKLALAVGAMIEGPTAEYGGVG